MRYHVRSIPITTSDKENDASKRLAKEEQTS